MCLKGNELVVTSQMRGDKLSARALWYDNPAHAELRAETLCYPEAGSATPMALVATQWSAISRGTERLVMSGKVPRSEYARMRAPYQCGDFPFPVKYGYCTAGSVEEGPPELTGRNVFVLHPHQDRFLVPADRVCPFPEALPPRRAPLAANMETALNAVWDSGAAPGDNIVVIGAGIVGLMICYLCAGMPGAYVTAVDPQQSRAPLARAFGAQFLLPEELGSRSGNSIGADVVFHASATPAGLSSALRTAGMESRIVEVSWYGDEEVPIPLGAEFHSRRLQLVSSQVGRVAPSRRQRWSHNRRLAKALDLLCDDRLDALITDEFRFEDLPQVLPDYLLGPETGLAAVVRY